MHSIARENLQNYLYAYKESSKELGLGLVYDARRSHSLKREIENIRALRSLRAATHMKVAFAVRTNASYDGSLENKSPLSKKTISFNKHDFLHIYKVNKVKDLHKTSRYNSDWWIGRVVARETTIGFIPTAKRLSRLVDQSEDEMEKKTGKSLVSAIVTKFGNRVRLLSSDIGEKNSSKTEYDTNERELRVITALAEDLHLVLLESPNINAPTDAAKLNIAPIFILIRISNRKADSYVCTSIAIDPDNQHFITAFKPNVEKHNAHHILVFGCEEPGSEDEIWDCGEMTATSDGLLKAPTCRSKPAIIYAWAKEAPELKLPKDKFCLPICYFLLSLTIITLKQPLSNFYFRCCFPSRRRFGNQLYCHAKSFETACVIEEDVILHPFAFRTHTHRHGKDVSGWVVREDRKGGDHWSLIGRRDPQLPQMFVPVQNQSMTITQGDMLTARCIMMNDEDRVVSMGATGDDEMCNFYIMYWAEGDQVKF
uniref:peptidylglycine monooxygenase n=1 Tax=Heterorhabditis bacteriophora TaxID=37862 RepID=A0A1I7XNI7_HETBA